MGIAEMKFAELFKLINDECDDKYSCLEYANFLRKKVLAEGTITPDSEVDDYKFLMQLLSYPQTETKLNEELGLVSFNDWELADLQKHHKAAQLQCTQLADERLECNKEMRRVKKGSQADREAKKWSNSLINATREPQKLEERLAAEIVVIKEKNKSRIENLSALSNEKIANKLLHARVADYLAANTDGEEKLKYLQEALNGYLELIRKLQAETQADLSQQNVTRLSSLLKRAWSLTQSFPIPPETLPSEASVKPANPIIEVTQHFWDSCISAKFWRDALALLDYLLHLAKQIALSTPKARLCAIDKTSPLFQALSVGYAFVDKWYTSRHGNLKKWRLILDSTQEETERTKSLQEMAKSEEFFVEAMHRRIVFLRLGDLILSISCGIPQQLLTDMLRSLEMVTILYRKTIAKSGPHVTKLALSKYHLLVLKNCLYGLALPKTKHVQQAIIDNFENWGAESYNWLTQSNRLQSHREEVQAKSVAKSENAKPYNADMRTIYTVFGVADIVLREPEIFLNKVSLETRRFAESLFNREIGQKTDNIESTNSSLEQLIYVENLKLLSSIEAVKISFCGWAESNLRKAAAIIENTIGTPVVEEKTLREMIELTRFVPQEHKETVTAALMGGFKAKTSAAWLCVARSVVAELEHCLRYWRKKTGREGYLYASFASSEEIVHLLGQKKVYYLQFLVCKDTESDAKLFDLRNRLAHGDITDSQAVDEEPNFKLLWHLFLHIVCEFISQKDLPTIKHEDPVAKARYMAYLNTLLPN